MFWFTVTVVPACTQFKYFASLLYRAVSLWACESISEMNPDDCIYFSTGV